MWSFVKKTIIGTVVFWVVTILICMIALPSGGALRVLASKMFHNELLRVSAFAIVNNPYALLKIAEYCKVKNNYDCYSDAIHVAIANCGSNNCYFYKELKDNIVNLK